MYQSIGTLEILNSLPLGEVSKSNRYKNPSFECFSTFVYWKSVLCEMLEKPGTTYIMCIVLTPRSRRYRRSLVPRRTREPVYGTYNINYYMVVDRSLSICSGSFLPDNSCPTSSCWRSWAVSWTDCRRPTAAGCWTAFRGPNRRRSACST